METIPLHLYLTEDKLWCTTNYKEVPLYSASIIVHDTKEKVDFLVNNQDKIEKFYNIYLLKERYKRNIFFVIDIHRHID